MMAKAPFTGAVGLSRQLAAVRHDAGSSIRTALSKGADEIAAFVGGPAPRRNENAPKSRCEQELAVGIAVEERPSARESSNSVLCDTQAPASPKAPQSPFVPHKDCRGAVGEEDEHGAIGYATGKRSDPVLSALLSARQALMSCSDIGSVVGTRVSLYDEPPGTASYPCIRIGSSHRTRHGLAFTVDAFAEDRETSDVLAGQIQDALRASTRSAPVVHLKTMTHQIGSANAPLYVSIATFDSPLPRTGSSKPAFECTTST